MAGNNTYTWSFPTVEVYKNQGNYTDVVYNIHWKLKGTDQSSSHSAEIYGVQSVPSYNPDSGSFVPFENLTKNMVAEWVLNSMGGNFGRVTASIDESIQDLINPPTQKRTPPWGTE